MGVFKWFILSVGWGCLNMLNKDKVKLIAYNKGRNLSQRFKNYKSWDTIMEPLIIRQFSFLFGVSNSFIKGLISDNKPDKNIKKSLAELNEEGYSKPNGTSGHNSSQRDENGSKEKD